MKTSLIRRLAEIILLATLVIILSLVIFSLRGGKESPSTASNLKLAQPYPSPEATNPSDQDSYPPPLGTATLPPSPGPVTPTLAPAFPETPPLPAGRAVTLFEGDIWLVEPGETPLRLTDYGDVAAIFGWNPGMTALLFGRGRTPQDDFGDTTELWVIDTITKETRHLWPSTLVKTASWSPIDEDKIAVCEHGNILTIIDLNGTPLYKLERAICTFTWSPDGAAISLGTYTPDMVTGDGLAATVLSIWWLSENKVQVFSNAKDEVQSWPIWSIDGKTIVYLRTFYEASKHSLSGVYKAIVSNGQTSRIENTSDNAEEMVRSPRADWLAFRLSTDIYVMDFNGQQKSVGQGRKIQWMPDGRNLLFCDSNGRFQVVLFDFGVKDAIYGGERPETGLYIQPVYFFVGGGIP
jgi:hypothetical protein